jgi:hypothetical protein
MERLAGLGGLHPGVGLLARNLQELLLHVDEGFHAPAHHVGNSMCGRPGPDVFLHAIHQDLVLLLGQVEKDFLAFNEVGYALSGHLAQNGRRGVMRIGQLLPHSMHYVRILPHHEVQQNPLRREQTLNPLLCPTG